MKWIAMILMTCGMAQAGVSTNFYADFDVPDSGGAGSLTQASQLDAGTWIGSWSIGDAQESLISETAAGFDQGPYRFTARMSAEANVTTGTVFTIDLRAKRNGSGDYNGIRIKNGAGRNFISLRWSGAADGVSGALDYWTGSWTRIATGLFFPADSAFSSGATDQLVVRMYDSSFDVEVNGVTVLSGGAYETDANEVGSIEFFGDGSAYCGAWYDRISLTSDDLYMNPFTSEWSIADPGLIKWRGTYYLYATGGDLRYWTSTNLVDWVYGGVAIPNTGWGLWAPSVRYWDGAFYCYVCNSDNRGMVYVSNGADPTAFTAVNNAATVFPDIDAASFLDDDGILYTYYGGTYGPYVRKMKDPVQTYPGAPDVHLTDCNNYVHNNWNEGPAVLRENDTYYMAFCGNHWLSNSYQVCVGNGSAPDSLIMQPDGPELAQTSGTWVAPGCVDFIEGPDLQELYAGYHVRRNGGTTRAFSLDRVFFEDGNLRIEGPSFGWKAKPEMPKFEDRFDRAEIGPDYVTDGGSWSIDPEQNLIQGSSGDALRRLICTQFRTAENCTVEATVRYVALGSGDAQFGVFVGPDTEDSDGVYLSISADENRLRRWVEFNGVTEDVRGAPVPSADSNIEPWDYSNWHVIRLEKRGNRYSFFLDGMKKMTTTCSYFADEYTGFFVKNCTAQIGWFAWNNHETTRDLPGVNERYFYAGFDVPDSGAAGSLTQASQLNAGTSLGSWTISDAQEALISGTAAGFDQGPYSFYAQLDSPAAVKDGVVFSVDMRSKRNAPNDFNAIRIKNERGSNSVSLRWSGAADGISGRLEYWTGSWTFITNGVFLPGTASFPDGQGTDRLTVSMDPYGYDVAVNGVTVLTGAAYENVPTSIESVQFFGDGSATLAGAWYDTVNVHRPYPTGYAAWADAWGTDIGAATDDYDGDGLPNLYEYGIGGDPLNQLDLGPGMVLAGAGTSGMLSFVYPRVSDLYSGIDYVFEANTNLVLGSWTNVNYSAGGTNVTGGALNYVTNQIPAVAPQQYIRLRIRSRQ